jgi:hypothetical protein
VQGTDLWPPEPGLCFGRFRKPKSPFEGSFHGLAILRFLEVGSRTFTEPPQFIAVDVTTFDRRHAAPFPLANEVIGPFCP